VFLPNDILPETNIDLIVGVKVCRLLAAKQQRGNPILATWPCTLLDPQITKPMTKSVANVRHIRSPFSNEYATPETA
jgi:hypothetical protein